MTGAGSGTHNRTDSPVPSGREAIPRAGLPAASSLDVNCPNLSGWRRWEARWALEVNAKNAKHAEDRRTERSHWSGQATATLRCALFHFSVPHYNGTLGGAAYVEVPGIPCGEYAYIQMVAWNGAYWGTALENVPLNQLGQTDILRHPLSCGTDPVAAPRFTQPAIVPPIPEPSTALLGLLGGCLLFAACLARRRRGCT